MHLRRKSKLCNQDGNTKRRHFIKSSRLNVRGEQFLFYLTVYNSISFVTLLQSKYIVLLKIQLVKEHL